MEASGPIRGLVRQSSFLLRIASVLVPKARRKQWYEQQRAQVWHWIHFLHESGRLNAASKRELAKHLWGAFREAFWQRFDRVKVQRLVNEVPRTPRFALLAITGLLLVVITATGFFPTIRWALSPLPYQAPDRLVNLSFNGEFLSYHPGNLFLTVSRWEQQSKSAQAIAAYSWETGKIKVGKERIDVISARVSPNFFDVLGVNAAKGRLLHPGDEKQCSNCIVISEWLWERAFHRDPALVGREIPFHGSSTVVGILPGPFWFISPEVSVWTLSPMHSSSINLAEHTGAVLRLRPGATRAEANAEAQNLVKDSGSAFGSARAELAPIKNQVTQGLEIYLLFILFAFLASLLILKVRGSRSGPLAIRVEEGKHRWWLFFAGKTALLLAACYVLAVEGTRRVFIASTGSVPASAGAVSSWFLLVATVLAVTWSLHDQGRRCHICLKRLSHESYVGVPARLLLDWWGTELVCSQGHGMLHLPEMRASWLEDEHWIQLDESWKPLFEPDEANVS